MPAIRGCYLTHPTTGEVGLWLELSTDPPGTLVGQARTAWPAAGANTLAQYQVILNNLYKGYCSLPGQPNTLLFGQQPPDGWYVSGNQLVPLVCQVAITLSSLSPVTISNVTVTEGAVKAIRLAVA